ncbi:MAG: phytoene desaturase family protein, partial [Myxococcota bacterium]
MPDAKEKNWDTIVIGSGLGGLSCAAYLCAAGKRTLVLEAHYVAGGNSQVFRRTIHGREYEFDVGLHYIGECGPDGLISGIFRGVGLAERVVWRPMDRDGHSTLVFPDFRFKVPAGWDRYRARILDQFPEERESLGRVVDILREVSAAGRLLQNREMDIGEAAVKTPIFLEWGLRPVTDLFKEHNISMQASAVLLGEQGDYAVRPSKTPVALAGGLHDHYMRGAFYPEGGGQVLAARLIEAIRAYGGEVRTRSKVRNIRIEDGRVAGVVLDKTGESIDAPIVVSNADLKRTVHDLVGEKHFSPDTVRKIRAYRMAFPLFGVYLGLDMNLAEMGHPNTNYFMWGTYDIEGVYEKLEAGEMSENMAYITTATLKDPTNPHLAPEGHTNLQLMTIVPKEYAMWHVDQGPVAAGNRYHLDKEYRSRKAALADHLIDVAEDVIPGLRKHIDWKEAATPVTQERFTRSTGGTSYGIELSIDQIGPLRMGEQTEIPGLYLCGASTSSGHGIGGVLRGGVITAGLILETDILKAVLRGEVFGDRDLLPELREEWD